MITAYEKHMGRNGGTDRRRVGVCILAFAMTLMTGCRSASEIPRDAVAQAYFQSPTSGAVIRPGLRLNVSVLVGQHEEVRVDRVRVVDDGHLTLPMLGSVSVDGMPVADLKALLTDRYSEFFVRPNVTVDFVLGDREAVSPWGHVTVLGRVRSPGRVPIPPTQELTVIEAIQQAGGLDSSARDRSVRIVRAIPVDGKRRDERVNLRRIDPSAPNTASVVLRAGDVVYVPESWF